MPINYNMRCIEINFIENVFVGISKINYNMRCIEIYADHRPARSCVDKLQHEMY